MAMNIKNLGTFIEKAKSAAQTLKVVVDNAKDVVDSAKPLIKSLKDATGKNKNAVVEQTEEPRTEIQETTPEETVQETPPEETAPETAVQEITPEVIPCVNENNGFQASTNIGIDIAKNSIMSAANPIELVNNLITTIGDVQKFCEDEKTKRCEIEKEKTIAVKKIENQTKIFMTYLEKSFDERKENFQEMFAHVDTAIKEKNVEMLAYLLDSINKLATSSPFKELANINTVQNKLQDKTAEWDF